MTSLLWILIAIQVVMGVFDTFYHHELTERLAWRPSQRYELQLHSLRNMLYALLFLVLGWLEVHGILAMLGGDPNIQACDQESLQSLRPGLPELFCKATAKLLERHVPDP